MPTVLNLDRDRIPDCSVYVGRPAKWGNPFVVGRDGTREEVLVLYGTFLSRRPDLLEAARRELRGRHLVCHCAPLACHADVLLRIANAPFAHERTTP